MTEDNQSSKSKYESKFIIPRVRKVPPVLDTVDGLKPTFYIYSNNKKKSFRIPQDEQVFKIGKGLECDIILEDKSVTLKTVFGSYVIMKNDYLL